MDKSSTCRQHPFLGYLIFFRGRSANPAGNMSGAGPLLTLGFAGYEIYSTERAYAMDRITLRERRANYVRIGGGFAGGLAGASAGAAGGAALGALTGPGALVFVPLFTAVRGIGGSIAGGIGGSAAADYGMNAWYRLEDEKLQHRFEERFISMRFPLD